LYRNRLHLLAALAEWRLCLMMQAAERPPLDAASAYQCADAAD